MGRPRGWVTGRTGLAPMPSPGRPGVNQREVTQAFWARIAAGDSSEDAAVASGVSQPVGSRWFRNAGGMAPIRLLPLSGRYLSFDEREEIALLNAQEMGVREIARRMGRSPSTISRELRRNAATRCGVPFKPTRSGFSPTARRISRTAASILALSIVAPFLRFELEHQDFFRTGF